MISSGQLNERITLQQMVTTRNQSGEQVVTFQNLETAVPASVKFAKGRRAVDYGEAWNPTTIVFTIRYSQSRQATDRVQWASKNYTVISLNPDRVNGTITITADLVDEGRGTEEE